MTAEPKFVGKDNLDGTMTVRVAQANRENDIWYMMPTDGGDPQEVPDDLVHLIAPEGVTAGGRMLGSITFSVK